MHLGRGRRPLIVCRRRQHGWLKRNDPGVLQLQGHHDLPQIGAGIVAMKDQGRVHRHVLLGRRRRGQLLIRLRMRCGWQHGRSRSVGGCRLSRRSRRHRWRCGLRNLHRNFFRTSAIALRRVRLLQVPALEDHRLIRFHLISGVAHGLGNDDRRPRSRAATARRYRHSGRHAQRRGRFPVPACSRRTSGVSSVSASVPSG